MDYVWWIAPGGEKPEDPRYRLTDVGKRMVHEWRTDHLPCAPTPIYDDAPGADDSFGWDANGSFVEGAR
jgi:DNA-binding PadR family transcriptional regulator